MAKSAELLQYHDAVWGRPVADPYELFGNLTMQIMQSGLNFLTVLKKHAGMKDAFSGFDYAVRGLSHALLAYLSILRFADCYCRPACLGCLLVLGGRGASPHAYKRVILALLPALLLFFVVKCMNTRCF